MSPISGLGYIFATAETKNKAEINTLKNQTNAGDSETFLIKSFIIIFLILLEQIQHNLAYLSNLHLRPQKLK